MGTFLHKKQAPKHLRVAIISVSTTRSIPEDKSGAWMKKQVKKSTVKETSKKVGTVLIFTNVKGKNSNYSLIHNTTTTDKAKSEFKYANFDWIKGTALNFVPKEGTINFSYFTNDFKRRHLQNTQSEPWVALQCL